MFPRGIKFPGVLMYRGCARHILRSHVYQRIYRLLSNIKVVWDIFIQKSVMRDVLTKACAIFNDLCFPSLRSRHFASNSALVFAAHTLPSSL